MRYCNVPYIFPVFICVQTRRMRREYGQKAVSFSQFISLILFLPQKQNRSNSPNLNVFLLPSFTSKFLLL